MTERELKMYAISGLLVRIKAEQQLLNKATDERQKQQESKALETLIKNYNELVNELRNENPL